MPKHIRLFLDGKPLDIDYLRTLALRYRTGCASTIEVEKIEVLENKDPKKRVHYQTINVTLRWKDSLAKDH